MKHKFGFLVLLLAIIATVFVAVYFSQEKEEKIQTTVVIPFAQGGDTDVWTRAVWEKMSAILEEEVQFINITGGSSGSIGVQSVFDSKHDGYTICGTSETTLTIPVMVGESCTSGDWDYYVAAGSKGLLCVRSDLNITSLEQLLEETKRVDRGFKIANTKGGLWFALDKLFETCSGAPFDSVDYDGSATAISGCVDGKADVVIASASELSDDIETGKLIPLCVMDEESYYLEGSGEIPSVVEYVPSMESYFPLNQFLGFSVPRDIPIERKEQLEKAFLQVMNSKEMQDFAEVKVAEIYNLSGEQAKEFVGIREKQLCWLLYELGVANYNPETLNIAK